MRHAVVIEKTENNYATYVPDLPSCVTTGKTMQEIENEIQENIQFHWRGIREDGLSIPVPSSL